MTRQELIERLAQAIAEYEGFFVTEEEARRRKIRWPTRAQRNANPGNIRRWRKDGIEYPRTDGYVDFVAWARRQRPRAGERELREKAEREGWRILRVLIGQYLSSSPRLTLIEMFSRYAPSADGNDPKRYAEYVARRLGVPADASLLNLIHERQNS